jgi:chromosome segregation ATPase
MPDNCRDANIERLFGKLDDVTEISVNIQKELSVISTKVDDFAYRLRKLEERDERHLEREEKVELLITRIEGIVERNESTMNTLEERVAALEKDMSTVKNNWGWFVAIVSAIGGAAGYLFNALMSFFK